MKTKKKHCDICGRMVGVNSGTGSFHKHRIRKGVDGGAKICKGGSK